MPGPTGMHRLAMATSRLTGSRGSAVAAVLVGLVLALVPSADGHAAGVQARAAQTATLWGSRTVARAVAHLPAGRAEAFSYTARSSGSVRAVHLYIASRARSSRLKVAIYTDIRGRPAVRLVGAVRNHPRARVWTTIAVRSTTVVAGRRYWLMVLPTAGTVALRYARSRACVSADRHRRRLRLLPRRLRARAWTGCRLSAYLSGLRSGAPSSSPPSGGSPPPPPPPPPPTPQNRNCFAKPSACGYPDQTNTGAPAGSATAVKNGDQQINSPGTYSGWNVQNGSVRINASNVTIKDFVVTNSGDTSNAILISSGVTNVTIEDSTLSGAATNNAIQYAVQNASDGSVTGLRLDMVNCTECWSGSGTLQGSYANANGVIAGSHYEDIYYGGGGGVLVVAHDTLYNPQSQTAAIFAKGDFGDIGTVSITNNLLAGGGYTIYGGLSGTGNVTGPVTVTGNRFARCLGSSIYDGYGYTCRGGADLHGYYPHSGYYGVAADFNKAVTTWSGNVWDDSLATVPEG